MKHDNAEEPIVPVMSPEEADIWYRQVTIDAALARNLPDGVFKIVFYNVQRQGRTRLLDPFEVFASTPRALVEDWIARSNRLMSSNFDVGNARLWKPEDYEAEREKFIRENPGFDEKTYSHAIHLGTNKAFH